MVRTEVVRSTIEPVLGTRLDLLIDTDTGRLAEDAALDEADRLEAILSAYRPDSAFARWRRGELDDLPAEIVAVLRVADDWYVRSAGAFHPNVGGLTARWRRAEAERRVPDDAELAQLADGVYENEIVATAAAVRVDPDVVAGAFAVVAGAFVVATAVEAAPGAVVAGLASADLSSLPHAASSPPVARSADAVRPWRRNARRLACLPAAPPDQGACAISS